MPSFKKLLTLTAIGILSAGFVTGCGASDQNPDPYIYQLNVNGTSNTTTVTNTTQHEFVYTANAKGIATSSFSVASLPSGTVSLTGTSPLGLGANQIAVANQSPVAVAIETNSNNIYGNLTTYAIDANTGALTFLSDQDGAFQQAFPGNDGVIDFVGQAAFASQTLAYVEDDASATIGAFAVQESGNGAGTLNFLGATDVVNHNVNSMAVVNVQGSTVLLTFEGDETYFTAGNGFSSVESWALNSDGSLAVIGESATTTLGPLGDAENVNGAAVYTTIAGTYATVTTDGNSTSDNNLYTIQVNADGSLTQIGATNVTAGTDQTFPIGAVYTQLSNGGQLTVMQQDGTVTTFAVNANGTLGNSTTQALPAVVQSTLGSGAKADSLIPNSTGFTAIFSTAAGDFFEFVTVNQSTGALVFTAPVSTQSSGAGASGPQANGGDTVNP